jgi:hypothetical protein
MDTAVGMTDVLCVLATNDACVVADEDFTPRRVARVVSEGEPKLVIDKRTAVVASSSIVSLLVNTPPTNGEVH